MAFIACRRCGRSLGESEPACSSCGEPNPDFESAGGRASSPPAPAGAGFPKALGFAAFGIGLAVAAYFGPRPGRGRTAAAPSSVPAAAAPAGGTGTVAAANGGGEAELATPPEKTSSGTITFYGVVYDLATKAPVPGANLHFSNGKTSVDARADVHGWYQAIVPVLSAEDKGDEDDGSGQYVSVGVQAFQYRPESLQERDPPLASLSPARRRGEAEEAGTDDVKHQFVIGDNVPLAELNFALIPGFWPNGMPAAEFADVSEPQEPDEVDEDHCQIYGIAYDLATKKPLRNATLQASSAMGRRSVITDGRGGYVLTVALNEMEGEVTLEAALPGYRPGLTPDRFPSLRDLGAAQRRAVAGQLGVSFGPVSMPSMCENGSARQDVVAVPQNWPAL